jgi:hypothetical protein
LYEFSDCIATGRVVPSHLIPRFRVPIPVPEACDAKPAKSHLRRVSLPFKADHSPSSESFSPSSRNATLVSSTFCGETPSAGATSTRSVSFIPAVAANFESTFV